MPVNYVFSQKRVVHGVCLMFCEASIVLTDPRISLLRDDLDISGAYRCVPLICMICMI